MRLDAIGVVEVSFFTCSVVVLDAMLKSADVALVNCQKKLGGRMVHMIIAGSTSDVEAAIQAAQDAGSIVGEKNIKVAVTISNPHHEILRLLNLKQE